ncbi:hypothetical protein CDSE_0654 [Candidatus Kinetoplastibacterium desouzaii TCC079E]|uniref:Ancillary SecYEG translocon subunit/Cell division coordinator CpoB TPR domain-containing protein n=1 Tax=Candidatus Kinetoplastidibacterium desouzai TCC079E TaxID=1208919 RepID=M1L2G7_9PROT|nr:tetratricopeptide repeat protein [Candidatus Kinetoplastibacterium desouzaii]AGF46943.1 hypothetical protein CDSE_0654 [Candidatus Kinetoplastibacterium desouzaii TCC079E]
MNKFINFRKSKFIFSLIVLLTFLCVYKIFFLSKISNNYECIEIFETLEKTINSNIVDKIKINELNSKIKQDYSNTSYAAMSSLMVANYLYEQSDLEGAKKELVWLINNNNHKIFKSIAILRLSNLFIDNEEYDKALEYLVTPSNSFDSLFNDRIGDIMFMENKFQKAKDFLGIISKSYGKG